jgi:glucose dehydrogenase
MLRTLAAFFIAPFPVALFQAAVVTLWPKAGGGVFAHPVSMFAAVCLYFYIVGLLLGLPAWLFIRRRSAALRAYAMLGLVTALIPVAAALVATAISGRGSAYIILYNLTLFGVGGMLAGALFWRIAIRQKPSAVLESTFG